VTDDNDRTQIPGQRLEFPAPGRHAQANDVPPLPLPDPVKESSPRLEALREWWADAWDDGGVLHDRWRSFAGLPSSAGTAWRTSPDFDVSHETSRPGGRGGDLRRALRLSSAPSEPGIHSSW
jgi:hypothetical protein